MKVTNGRPQLHATALNLHCGEAFRRRYIENEIIPPGVAAVVGKATDAAVTRNLQAKIDTGALLPEGDVADTARDQLAGEWRGGVLLTDDDPGTPAEVRGRATDKAVRLAVLHARGTAPALTPTRLQRPWALELRGFPLDLVGTLDIQEPDRIRDTKTADKTPPEDVAASSLQLTAYHLAVSVIDGAPPAEVALDYLIDTKTPQTKTFTATRDVDDHRALLARVEVITRAIERGVFVPVNPSHWMCCPRWCGYFATCRYARRPVTVAAGSVNQ